MIIEKQKLLGPQPLLRQVYLMKYEGGGKRLRGGERACSFMFKKAKLNKNS